MNSNWKDISTAPKDGTHVIGFITCGPSIRNCTSAVVWRNNGWNLALGHKDVQVEVSHWLPIPPPPKTQEQEDLEAFRNWIETPPYVKATAETAWMAALQYARSQLSGK